MHTDLYDLPDNKAFLVSAKGIILNVKGEILLLQVSKDEPKDEFRLKWDVPGGLVEVDEKLSDALTREIKEECGIKVKRKQLVSEQEHLMKKFIFKNGTIKDVKIILLAYMCEYLGGDVKLSNEHESYRWVNVSKLDDFEILPNTNLLIRDALKLSKDQG